MELNSDNMNPLEQIIIDREIFGSCPECNELKTSNNWCMVCNSKRFRQNFVNWTSGDEYIDKFIRDAQLSARTSYELLEWIPYNRLRNIQFLAKGGFSIVYRGIWLDGWAYSWDYEKQDWKRRIYKLDEQNYKSANNPEIKNPLNVNEQFGFKIVLKSLNDSSNLHEDILNECKLYLQCQKEALSNGSNLIPLLGITQDPDTSNYIIVMCAAFNGNLRDNLLVKKYNPNDKFHNLHYILLSLEAIHELNLVHGDFHDGNLLLIYNRRLFISDLGLCRPVDQPNQTNIKKEIRGVLPYMAPEVLRGKPYTKAADIYSFGIIMWEMTSGVPAFHGVPHDFHFSLDICKGKRPKIVEGTMPEYVELMKRCWDSDPEKRPTAKELRIIFSEWEKKYPIVKDVRKRIPVPENEPKIIYHPKSCYTSRKFDYSAKLNEVLTQDELSDQVVIIEDDGNCDNEISESLADCIIKEIEN